MTYTGASHDHRTGGPEEIRRGGDGIWVIRGGETCRQWNNIRYKPGLSAKNCPATKLSMNVATIPPGGVAYAHIHVDFDVMLYILAGRVRHEYGDGCRQTIENQAGDFIYIEPAVPHEVFNVSDTEPVVGSPRVNAHPSCQPVIRKAIHP